MTSQPKKTLPDLASHLPSLFGRKNWQTVWQTYTLLKHWSEIAGEKIAKRSEPAYIQKNILWVAVRDSVWMQHLQTMKPELVRKVRDFLPETEIRDIRWIMQPAEPLPAAPLPDRRTEHPPDPEQKKAFERIASTVENKDCRIALCRLWATYHRFQQ